MYCSGDACALSFSGSTCHAGSEILCTSTSGSIHIIILALFCNTYNTFNFISFVYKSNLSYTYSLAVWGASMSSAADGSKSHLSEPSAVAVSVSNLGPGSNVDRLGQYFQNRPAYFASPVRQGLGSGEIQNLDRNQNAQHHVPCEDFFLASGEGEDSILNGMQFYPRNNTWIFL